MAGQLVAGAARVDITPADLRGLNAFGPDFVAVRDHLHARALVVSDGSAQVALVSLDVVEVGDTTEVRRRVEKEVGIPADHIMLAASHAHNAPRVGFVPPGGKARIPTPESLAYTALVEDAIVAVIREAAGCTRQVSMGIAGEDVDVNICREAYVDGRWTLGYVPDGLSDKTLTVVSFVDGDGEVVAAIVNYAVHSTVMLGVLELSADLAGSACTEIEALLGGDAVVLWTAGSLGDQAPKVEFATAKDSHVLAGASPEEERAFAHAAVDSQGFMLAATATRLIRREQRRTNIGPVQGQLTVYPCPARKLEVPPGMEQADVDTVDLTLTCLTVGPLALAGVSGEVTVPVGRAVKAASPLAHTLIVTNANARIGYLPTDESYDRHTQAADGCPIVQGHAQRTIVDGIARMIEAVLATS